MNAQHLATNLPKYLVVVVLLALAGCTASRAATIETNPVSIATLSVSRLPEATQTSTPNTASTQISPVATSSPTLSPTASVTSIPLPSATPAPSPVSIQIPDPPIERRLLVDQDKQTMFVYENNTIVRTILVSTGAPVTNMFTPPWDGIVGDDWGSGPFRNRQLADFKWFLFPGPEGSILIHSVPYTITQGLKVYDRPEALGVEPVSNGCIRISSEDGAWLKNWNPVNVPITITRWSGKIQPADTTDQAALAEERKNE